jgi:ribose 5-phosphate isomerase A
MSLKNIIDREKAAAARASLKYIHDGDVVGLGTGSTAKYVVEGLADMVRAGMKVQCIPTSVRTRDLATSLGITLTTLEQNQHINVTIDGADEFDPQLNLTKGGGGALLREKIVASASDKLVIIADSTKQVPVLGAFPLPVEVIPFAETLIAQRIAVLGAAVKLRVSADGKPFVTDEGHHILDCKFDKIPDPPSLARKLECMPGIVEHGLFIGMADIVMIGKGDEIIELRRN